MLNLLSQPRFRRPLAISGACAAATVLLGVSSAAPSVHSSSLRSTPHTTLHAPEPGSDAWWAELAAAFGGTQADTKPLHDVTMTFSFPVTIDRILATGGMRVKAGDPLVAGDVTEAAASLASQALSAQSTHAIEDAQAALDLATFRRDRRDEIVRETGAQMTPLEKIELETAVRQAQARLISAQEELRLNELRYEQGKAQFDRYSIVAPFDGEIEEVYASVGQSIRETDPIIHVVGADTLTLDPYAKLVDTLTLKPNAPAWVLIRLGTEHKVVKGRVAYVSAVSDAVTRTRRVRVEIPNPSGWPAGTPAEVRFSQPAASSFDFAPVIEG